MPEGTAAMVSKSASTHAGWLALSLAVIAGCSAPADGPVTRPALDGPAFDATWRISTHNSYWVDRLVSGDLFASGTQERIADQLFYDHARGIEIDVHPDDATPGGFLVYHTVPGNGLCGTLGDCLALVRALHYALPQHEALHVTLELKALTTSNFDASHTVEDLDAALGRELGAALYRPADLLRRCDDAFAAPRLSLAACVRALGWPGAKELRGKILVSVLGNWDGLPGARATRDWADYALHGDVRGRAAFPMASSWQLDREALSGPIHELLTQEELDAALLQSVFFQVEDTADPRLSGFVAQGGVVRLDGAVTAMDQAARIALGAQLLQGDSPWIQADDHGPSQPSRPLHGADPLIEPGTRFTLHPAGPGAIVFAHGAPGAWEAAISSGSDPRRAGCLRAETALGGGESIAACRSKIAADRGDGTAMGKGSIDAERMILHVTVCHAGNCATTDFPSIDPEPGGPGDLVAMEVTADANGSCARVRSTAAVSPDLSPAWSDVTKECFPAPLAYEGLSLPAAAMDAQPAMFFGVRRGGAPVAVSAFAGVVMEAAGSPPAPMPALLEDGSAGE
jgi:hypothetical protein